ncbi:MAG: hypothetical protein WCF65_07690 [Parachlamydiaceae bacterium]
MKKSFLFTLVVLTATLLVTQQSTVEARHHSRSTSVHVGVGTAYASRNMYIVRQAPRPIMVTPIYAPVPYYYAPYGAPVYAYPSPVYVEEVYVQRPPSIGLAGLSFSWNFFR